MPVTRCLLALEKRQGGNVDHAGFSLSGVVGLRAQDTQSVAGDHQFLVGGDDVATDPRSFSRDPSGALGIRLRVKLKAEPGQALRHGIADGRRVFADARREHEGVDALHCRPQHPGEKSDSVDEIVERELGARVRTRRAGLSRHCSRPTSP